MHWESNSPERGESRIDGVGAPITPVDVEVCHSDGTQRLSRLLEEQESVGVDLLFNLVHQ